MIFFILDFGGGLLGFIFFVKINEMEGICMVKIVFKVINYFGNISNNSRVLLG